MPEFKYDLTYSGGTITLDNDPVGWEDAALKLKRDTDYHGVFKEYTFDLQFHCKGGGKTEIDGDYDTKGIQANVTLSISYKCAEGDDWTEIFDGKLDFSKYERTKDFSTVTIVRNDLSKLVMDRIEQDVEMSSLEAIDGGALTAYDYAGYDLNLHSKEILQLTRFDDNCGIVREYGQNNGTAGTLNWDYYFAWADFDNSDAILATRVGSFAERIDEFDVGKLITNELGLELTGDAPGTFTTAVTNYFVLNSDTPSTINIDYAYTGSYEDEDVSASANRGTNNAYIFRIYKGTTNLASASVVHSQTIFNAYFPIAAGSDYSTTFDFSGTYTDNSASSGDKYWCIFYTEDYTFPPSTVSPATRVVKYNWEFTRASLELNAKTTTDASTGKAWAAHEAMSRICESITGQVSASGSTGLTAFKSNFFGRTNSEPATYGDNGCGSFTAFTNGYMIRGFQPLNDEGVEECSDNIKRGVFFSLDKIFQCANTLYNVGLGVEYDTDRYVVRVEPKSYFYDKTTTILSCPNIDELTMRFASDWCYSQGSIGFDKWKVEDLNGADEPITKQERIAPGLKQLKNKYEAVTDFIAGMYAIEYTRRSQAIDTATTDTDFDNDNFVIALNRSVDVYTNNPSALDEAEKDENFASVTGLFEPDTAYNLRFSPVRCLLRHLNVLGAGLTKASVNNDKKLIFSKGYNNYEMTSDMDSDGCAGDYTANPISETTTLEWDDANARLNEPLWQPEIYTFDYPLSFSEWISLVNSPYGVVQFSETSANYKKGYILNLEYQINKGLASFELLRAYE